MIPVDKLHSIGVVVTDLEIAMAHYGEMFGIDVWDVAELTEDRLTEVVTHGRATTGAFRSARGATTPPRDDRGRAEGRVMNGELDIPVHFELIQPISGESPFQEHLLVKGPGITHLTLAVSTPEEFPALAAELAAAGLPLAASFTVDSAVERHFVDTRDALGGYLVEILVPRPGSLPAAYGERVSVAGNYTRPEGVNPLAVRSVAHFGIVVNDAMEAVREYHRILGVPSFNMREWRTEPGRLEDPYFRGEPVTHAYFTGITPFKDFGLEIIQPTHGPSHYNRLFRDLRGPGVHHMLLQVTSNEDEWDAVEEWLAGAGMPRIMGAELMRGAMCFCYYDTFDRLGGYLIEGVLSRRPADEDVRRPDFFVDFAALAPGR